LTVVEHSTVNEVQQSSRGEAVCVTGTIPSDGTARFGRLLQTLLSVEPLEISRTLAHVRSLFPTYRTWRGKSGGLIAPLLGELFSLRTAEYEC
jgi:hypothetical protein